MSKKDQKMSKKLKVLVVGDIHGRHELVTEAFDVFLKQHYDKIIFIGDYTDSFDRSDQDIIRCINVVTGMKQTYPDGVILLIGNHDEQYLNHDVGYGIKCSGFRPKLHLALSHVMIAKKKLFHYAYGIGNYLFTHAGVSQSWFLKHFDLLDLWSERMSIDITDVTKLHIVLNNLQFTSDKDVLLEIGPDRGGLDANYGGPLWCDQTEILLEGPLPGLHQVVGHTKQHFISRVHSFGDPNKKETYDDTTVTFIDCLSYRHQFLSLEIEDTNT